MSGRFSTASINALYFRFRFAVHVHSTLDVRLWTYTTVLCSRKSRVIPNKQMFTKEITQKATEPPVPQPSF